MRTHQHFVFENVREMLELGCVGIGWIRGKGLADVNFLLMDLGCSAGRGCFIITAVEALLSCSWPWEVRDKLQAVPLNGHYSQQLIDAFRAVEHELYH